MCCHFFVCAQISIIGWWQYARVKIQNVKNVCRKWCFFKFLYMQMEWKCFYNNSVTLPYKLFTKVFEYWIFSIICQNHLQKLKFYRVFVYTEGGRWRFFKTNPQLCILHDFSKKFNMRPFAHNTFKHLILIHISWYSELCVE